MISTAKVQLGSHFSPQTLLEITHELDILIPSDRPRNVMQTKNPIKVKMGYSRCINGQN
jgi:hypothetical protein